MTISFIIIVIDDKATNKQTRGHKATIARIIYTYCLSVYFILFILIMNEQHVI